MADTFFLIKAAGLPKGGPEWPKVHGAMHVFPIFTTGFPQK